MKYLYKYPQAAFPYADLVETNRRRGRHDMEYELLDTGVFQDDRYFDVFVEYAKSGPEDILVRITAVNRGPDAADLHLLPTLWFRNDWSQWIAEIEPGSRETAHQADRGTGRRDRGRGGASAAGGVHRVMRRRRAAALHRKRNQSRPAVRDREREPLRQGRHQRVRGTRPAGRGESRANTAPRSRRTTRSRSAPVRRRVIRLRLASSFLDQKGQPFGKPFDQTLR